MISLIESPLDLYEAFDSAAILDSILDLGAAREARRSEAHGMGPKATEEELLRDREEAAQWEEEGWEGEADGEETGEEPCE